MSLHRLAAFAVLFGVAALSCAAVVIAGRPADAHADRPPAALPRITPRTSIADLSRHFGRPTESSFHGGAQVDVWVSRRHDWTVVRYIHPRPRPNP